jgi:hypothetical protein
MQQHTRVQLQLHNIYHGPLDAPRTRPVNQEIDTKGSITREQVEADCVSLLHP